MQDAVIAKSCDSKHYKKDFAKIPDLEAFKVMPKGSKKPNAYP